MSGSRGHNLLPLHDRQRLQDGLRRSLRSLGSDVQDAGAVDIGGHGDGVLPFSEALLVDTDVGNGRRLASLEASFEGPIHDRLGRIPGEPEEGRRSLDGAARLQDFDGEGFEKQGETALLSCPRRHD